MRCLGSFFRFTGRISYMGSPLPVLLCVCRQEPQNDQAIHCSHIYFSCTRTHRYAGGHINGIARIRLGQQEAAWTWINDGLLGEDLWQNETIVPAIQVDPANGGGWLWDLEHLGVRGGPVAE
jgi:hypothetical protein